MTFEMSAGLARELDIRSARKDELLQYLGSSASLESWTVGSNKNLVVEQTRNIARFLLPKASVLDVGFGVGFSSLELGRLGFSVDRSRAVNGEHRNCKSCGRKVRHQI